MSIEKINNTSSSITSPTNLMSSGPKMDTQGIINSFDDIMANINVHSKGLMPVDMTKTPVHNYNIIGRTNLRDDDKIETDHLFAQVDENRDVLPVFEEVERRREERILAEREAMEEKRLTAQRYVVTPFQKFIDQSIEVLENISQLDYRVNDLTEQYIRGEVSVEEVSFAITKLNLAISFATTVISSASQTFKELTQLQI